MSSARKAHYQNGLHICTDKCKKLMLFVSNKQCVQELKSLLTQGVDLRHTDEQGWTALHYAAKANVAEAVEVLVRYGVGVDVVDKKGATPLMVACMENHVHVVELLLRLGAQVEHADPAGQTAVMCAAEKGHFAVVMILIDHKADINRASKQGYTPLMLASKNRSSRTVELLLKHGARIDCRSERGWNAMLLATLSNDPFLVNLMLQAGCQINDVSSDGWTNLHLAAKNGNQELVDKFIKKCPDVNVRNKNDWTPLMLATQNGHLETVKKLIQCKADPALRSRKRETAVMIAARKGHTDILNFLITNDVSKRAENEKDALVSAAQNGSLEAARYVLENLNPACRGKRPALLQAAYNGHDTLVDYLCQKGTDVNYKERDGCDAMMLACVKGHDMVVCKLAANGADVNKAYDISPSAKLFVKAFNVTTTPSGAASVSLTPLLCCILFGNLRCVDTLISLKCDVNKANSYGTTPVALAQHLTNTVVVAKLHQHGAKRGGGGVGRSCDPLYNMKTVERAYTDADIDTDATTWSDATQQKEIAIEHQTLIKSPSTTYGSRKTTSSSGGRTPASSSGGRTPASSGYATASTPTSHETVPKLTDEQKADSSTTLPKVLDDLPAGASNGRADHQQTIPKQPDTRHSNNPTSPKPKFESMNMEDFLQSPRSPVNYHIHLVVESVGNLAIGGSTINIETQSKDEDCNPE
ncbi:ankyrin-3-like [Physella acuta]|uniref:ankyrin-3-like n=1 Tax=Physella acuta TaxID=109671 RepID=UPI0027DC0816|nr:ankyrin-3-like [Physella acuta]